MKIKINENIITTLKSPDQYRRWKQEVEMLAMALGCSYLLSPYQPPPSQSLDVSASASSDKGKEKKKEGRKEGKEGAGCLRL